MLYKDILNNPKKLFLSSYPLSCGLIRFEVLKKINSHAEQDRFKNIQPIEIHVFTRKNSKYRNYCPH
jgi:hypothetical protein